MVLADIGAIFLHTFGNQIQIETTPKPIVAIASDPGVSWLLTSLPVKKTGR